MILKELKLTNFLSHENTQINFTENEKLLIDGRSGSGKSSITEAILWVLYGKGRSENRSLIRRGSKNATVSVKLMDIRTETLITRSVSSTGKNTLTITQKTGTKGQFLPIQRTGLKDTQDWIEKEFLKASYELFTNSIAYPQESEHSFVKANASKRKDLLLEIIRAGNFDELYEKTKKVITAKETENTITLYNISRLEDTIKTSKEVSIKYNEHKQKNEFTTIQLDALTKVEKEIEANLYNISATLGLITDKKKLLKSFNDSIISIDLSLENNKKTVEEFNSLNIETARKDIKDAEEMYAEIVKIEKELRDNAIFQSAINSHLANKPGVHDYTKDLETINKRLIPLIKDSSSCPAGDACPFVVPIKGQIDFLTEQITEKTTNSEKEQAQLKKWEEEYVKLVPTKDITGLYEKLESLRKKHIILSQSKDIINKYELLEKTIRKNREDDAWLLKQKQVARNDVTELQIQINELEDKLTKFDVNKSNIDLANCRVKIQELRKEKEESTLIMSLATKAQEDIKVASKELVGLKKTLVTAKEDYGSLELLKEALSPRGIKAVVIDYLVPQLEERINLVLGQMSDFKIRLDTQAAKADEGVKEGLFITVINDRKEELPFDNYSGGEKVKITVAISEALASLMNQVGFRIMDENIVSLDKESTEGFILVLEKLQNKFPQLLVISHLQEVKDMFEKKVEIIKVNGISKIL